MRKFIILFFSFLFCLAAPRAQSVPYSWTFTAVKTADGSYEIHCLAEVKAPWHVYSQFTPAGGPVPTQFSFTKNPLCSLEGKTMENGKMITRHEAVFGIDVKYFEGTVDFIQKLKLKENAKTNFSGSVTFMVCNDAECLPPATQKFSVALP